MHQCIGQFENYSFFKNIKFIKPNFFFKKKLKMFGLSDLFEETNDHEILHFKFDGLNCVFTLLSQNIENQHIASATSTIVWGGSVALSNYICKNPTLVIDRHVLELGFNFFILF
jgi:hypothetical protein